MFREFVVAKERQRRELRRDVTLAWTTAAYVRQPRLPELLRELACIGDAVEPKRSGVSQQRAVLEQLSAKHGIPLRRGHPTGISLDDL